MFLIRASIQQKAQGTALPMHTTSCVRRTVLASFLDRLHCPGFGQRLVAHSIYQMLYDTKSWNVGFLNVGGHVVFKHGYFLVLCTPQHVDLGLEQRDSECFHH